MRFAEVGLKAKQRRQLLEKYRLQINAHLPVAQGKWRRATLKTAPLFCVNNVQHINGLPKLKLGGSLSYISPRFLHSMWIPGGVPTCATLPHRTA